MRPFVKNILATAIPLVFSIAISCRHQIVTSSVPKTAPETRETLPEQADQVNIAGWDGAWTNLLNTTEQSFVPSFPRLVAAEVELVIGNPGPQSDGVTLSVLDAEGQVLATVTKEVQAESLDHIIFQLPAAGIGVSPGRLYRLRLTDGSTFGWKCVVGGYEKGEATFNGKPLLRDARSTFLFRTFGRN
jgi:hypothetical protein